MKRIGEEFASRLPTHFKSELSVLGTYLVNITHLIHSISTTHVYHSSGFKLSSRNSGSKFHLMGLLQNKERKDPWKQLIFC